MKEELKMNDLNGKVVLVTGSAQGIGLGIAKKFLDHKSKVVISDINQEALDIALKQLSGDVMSIDTNVAKEEDVVNMLNSIIQKWGRIDILINNAGITADTLFIRMKKETWQKVLDVNLTGTYLCAYEATKYMRKQKSGNIINISSISARGNPGQANYAASKAGVIGFTKTIAKELAPMGIRVNAVAPGFIQTAMTDKIPDKIKNAMVSDIPIGRIGQPEDIANAILFLSSNLSSYITGEIINVNGGIQGV